MRRVALVITMVLVASACSSEAEPTPAITPSTTATTTIPTTTTTTEPLIRVEGTDVDPSLVALIESLYALPAGDSSVAAPPDVIASFQAAKNAVVPAAATVHAGSYGDATRVAVVEADQDVTLAVADPEWRVVGGWWPSHQVDAVLGDFPKTIAVVGSDARPNEDREQTRSDSIHFVTLDSKGAAVVVGLPRDSWVPIPGGGNSKINAALSLGGPELMMATFTELTGAEFDGYLLTGFKGFQEMIGVLGGLEIDVPTDLNDSAAKASLKAGLQLLDGANALAFTRVRKSLPNGDFGRQANGGLALIAAATMVKAMGVSAVPSLMEQSYDMYSTDMTPEDLLLLAAAITRVDPAQVANVVAAGSAGSAGAASVVFLQDAAYTTFADMVDGRIGEG